MKDIVNCAIYTRVSTDNQAEVEFNSCESQKEKIEHFIQSQEGFGIHKIYSDEGYSGKDMNRPALQNLLREIEIGKINCVLTYKMDRLTRCPKDFYQMIEHFDKYKVNYISVTERFDTSTPAGRLLRNIMLTFAQFERELISERVRDKMLQRAVKGMWNGGVVPYGYKNENKKLIINEKEAKVVRLIYDKYIETQSITAVYKMLIDQNFTQRDGRPFSKTTIYYILRSIIYVGKIKYGDKIYDANHEPIISKEIFDLAQQCHKEKNKRKFRTYKKYVFPGMIKCKECGSTMTPSHTTKRVEGRIVKYYYYRCTSTFKHKWNTCSTRQISAERLERLIFNDLETFSIDNHSIENLFYRIKTEGADSSNSDNKNSVQGWYSGLGTREACSKLDPKMFQEQLKMFLKAAANTRGIDKCLLTRKYVADILYSKETIEINLYYHTHPNNQKGSTEHTKRESDAHPQDDCAKSIYSSRIGDIENGLKYRET